MITNNIFSSLRLRQIINDLKRRPLDASKDLSLNPKTFDKYLKGKIKIDENFVRKAVKVWPVNISDFINFLVLVILLLNNLTIPSLIKDKFISYNLLYSAEFSLSNLPSCCAS